MTILVLDSIESLFLFLNIIIAYICLPWFTTAIAILSQRTTNCMDPVQSPATLYAAGTYAEATPSRCGRFSMVNELRQLRRSVRNCAIEWRPSVSAIRRRDYVPSVARGFFVAALQ